MKYKSYLICNHCSGAIHKNGIEVRKAIGFGYSHKPAIFHKSCFKKCFNKREGQLLERAFNWIAGTDKSYEVNILHNRVYRLDY